MVVEYDLRWSDLRLYLSMAVAEEKDRCRDEWIEKGMIIASHRDA